MNMEYVTYSAICIPSQFHTNSNIALSLYINHLHFYKIFTAWKTFFMGMKKFFHNI